MQYYRCKCGKMESWGSMPPNRCQGCPDCGTNLSTHPDHHPPADHNWSANKVQTDDGPATLTVCSWCGIAKVDTDA